MKPEEIENLTNSSNHQDDQSVNFTIYSDILARKQSDYLDATLNNLTGNNINTADKNIKINNIEMNPLNEYYYIDDLNLNKA